MEQTRMNIHNIIYNHCSSPKNYGHGYAKPDTLVYIIPSLLENPAWKHYKTFGLATYEGVKNYILEMAFITNMAYTFYYTGERFYEISPYYIESLYRNFISVQDMRKSVTYEKRTNKVISTSKIIKDYVNVDCTGSRIWNEIEEKSEFVFSKYSITNKLVDLSSYFAEKNNSLICIDLEYLAHMSRETFLSGKKGTVERMKEWSWECDGKYFESYYKAKVYSNRNGKLPYWKHEYIDIILDRKCDRKQVAFKEYDKCSITNEKNDTNYPVSLKSSFNVNRDKVHKLLTDVNSGSKYGAAVISELNRMYHMTTDENNRYEILYRQTKQGRHYAQGSNAQMFPKELREYIFEDYVELDIKSSIYTLYLNLAKKYGYKKPLTELEKLVADSRAYRMQFVNEDKGLSYDNVKTVLTAIAYGARVDVYNMYHELETGFCFHKSSLLYTGGNPRAIIDMVNTDSVFELTQEIHGLGNFLMKQCRAADDKSMIENIFGYRIKTGKSVSFGKKLAHIYQAWEAKILETVKNMKVDGRRLCDIENSVGLYLHDGIYIHKNVAKMFDNIAIAASNEVERVTGLKIAYECA